MALRYSFGAASAPAVPQEFWSQADTLLEMARGVAGAYRNAGWSGADTLDNVIRLKTQSLSDVRAGALSASKWLDGMSGFLDNVQASIQYMDRTSNAWDNITRTMSEMKQTIASLKRMTAAAVQTSVAAAKTAIKTTATAAQGLVTAGAGLAADAARPFIVSSVATAAGVGIGAYILWKWLK